MPAKTQSLHHAIDALMRQGRYSELVDRCHIELTLARREGKRGQECLALQGLAQGQCSLGNFAFARDYAQEALELAEADLPPSAVVDALLLRARIAREGYLDSPAAAEDAERAVSLAHEAGDMRRYASALLAMGEAAKQADDAQKHAWRCIDLARDLADECLEARAILLLGNSFIRKQKGSQASDALFVALEKAQKLQHRLLESVIIGQQGAVLAQSSESFARGMQQQKIALEASRNRQAVYHEYMRLYSMARSYTKHEMREQARASLDEMLALAQDIQHEPYAMYALGLLGQYHEQGGQLRHALDLYSQAREQAQALCRPSSEARYSYAIGMLRQKQWQFAPARHEFQAARALYRSIDDSANATRVLAAIAYSYLLQLLVRCKRMLGMQPAGG